MKNSRDICKKCWCDSSDGREWCFVDDYLWSMGRMHCVLPGTNYDLNPSSPRQFPPVGCPYVTEHVVLRKAAKART